MNFYITIGILSVLLFLRSYALDYSILENLEATCLPRDNCMLAHSSSFENRSCECDSQCNNFRDCCIDKAYLAPATPLATRRRSCMAFGGQHQIGVYAIDSCPHSYRASAEIRSLCQEDDFYDPFSSAPVTVVSTNTTYKNQYCAECNGFGPSTLLQWKLYLNCPSLVSLNLNDSYIWQNLEYNTSALTWGVKHDDVFHSCEVIFEKPPNLTAVRLCRANTIDTCPPSFLRIAVKRYCESYSAVVYDSENAYKNPHCAICNNRTLDNLLCSGASLMNRNRKPFTFAHLLDVNTRDGNRVGMVDKGSTCPSGQRYDPFFRKCRRPSCVLPGFVEVNGKCKKG